MAFDVSGLTPFKDEELMSLIRSSYLESNTIQRIDVVPNIKHSATINLIGASLTAQDGGNCGFNPSGTTNLTQRVIEVSPIKYETRECIDVLEDYYLGKMMSAGSYNEELPFRDIYAEEMSNIIAKDIAVNLWQGDSANTGEFDGFLSVIDAEASVVDGNVDSVTAITAANVIDVVDEMISVIPTDASDADDLTLFVGNEVFRMYQKALRDASLYHYPSTPNGQYADELIIPATNVTMVADRGLKNTNRMVLAEASNLKLGTDLVNDYADFQLWYDEKEDAVLFRSKMKYGTQVAFPERIVEFTLA